MTDVWGSFSTACSGLLVVLRVKYRCALSVGTMYGALGQSSFEISTWTGIRERAYVRGNLLPDLEFPY